MLIEAEPVPDIYAYRILEQKIENAPSFLADYRSEFYGILRALRCSSKVQIFYVTKELLKEAKRKAEDYETLEKIAEFERALEFSGKERIEFICK
jgi:hypothetical protein